MKRQSLHNVEHWGHAKVCSPIDLCFLSLLGPEPLPCLFIALRLWSYWALYGCFFAMDISQRASGVHAAYAAFATAVATENTQGNAMGEWILKSCPFPL